MALADNMPNDRPGDLWRRIADIERAIRELRAARTLDQATITALAGLGIRTSDFDGTDFAHPGTQGNYFGGDGLVLNQAYFRPGSVSNDALTQPVVPGVSRASASNFALTVAWAELAGQTLTVPSLATTLLATVSGRLYAVNPRTSGGADGTGTDALFVSVQLGAQASQATPTGISGSNGFATSNCSESFIATGLTPGSTIRLSVYGSSGYQSLAAQADNYASFAATLVWLR